MNTAVRQRRLCRLANYLENLPSTVNFNMGTWGVHAGEHPPQERNYCGTTACALGHAAMIPEFNRAGLAARWMVIPLLRQHLYEKFVKKGKTPTHFMDVEYDESCGEYAGKKFFGLTHRETVNLFLSTSKPRKWVIKELRRLATLPYTKDPEVSD